MRQRTNKTTRIRRHRFRQQVNRTKEGAGSKEPQSVNGHRSPVGNGANDVLALQRTIGNQAVSRLLANSAASRGIVQRLPEGAPAVAGGAEAEEKESLTDKAKDLWQRHKPDTSKLGDKTTEQKRRWTPGQSGVELTTAVTDAASITLKLITGVGEKLVGLADPLKEMVKETAQKAAEALSNNELIGSVVEAIQTVVSTIFEHVGRALESLPLSDIMDVASKVMPIVGGVITTLVSIVQTIQSIFKLKKRVGHLMGLRKGIKRGGEAVKNVAQYGFRKVVRAVIDRVYLLTSQIGRVLIGLTDLGLDIAAAVSFGGTEAGKIATLAASLGLALIDIGRAGFRVTKGIYKAVKGTRAKHRFENAETLVKTAQESEDASEADSAKKLLIDLGAFTFTGQMKREMKLGAKALLSDITAVSKAGAGKLGGMMSSGQEQGEQMAEEGGSSAEKSGAAHEAVAESESAPSVEEQAKIKSAFLSWGKDNIKDFVTWLQANFGKKEWTSASGIWTMIKKVMTTAKDVVKRSKEDQQNALEDEFTRFKGDKRWRKVLISFVAERLKST